MEATVEILECEEVAAQNVQTVGFPTTVRACLVDECAHNYARSAGVARCECRLRTIEIADDGTCATCHKSETKFVSEYRLGTKPTGRGWDNDE